MRCGDEQLAAFPEHGAEIGLRRLRAEAEKGEACRLEDHPADRGRHGDDDDGRDVRQNLGPDDAEVAHAGKPGRIDELPMGDPHRRTADVAGEEGDVDGGDGIEGVEKPRPQYRDDGEREQDVGKRHEHVDAAHQEVVGAPAEEAGGDAGRRADDGGERGGGDADGKAEPRAPDEAGEQVAAEVVGAEGGAVGERRLQPVGGSRRVRIGEGEQRRKQRDDGHRDQHRAAEGREAVAQDQLQRGHGSVLKSRRAGRASVAPGPREG